MQAKKTRPPKLPQLLETKISKTGQTRGADDNVIYQNRVSRTSTVLIPFRLWDQLGSSPYGETNFFESGYIVLLTPSEYFNKNNINEELASKNLFLGKNALVFLSRTQ